MAGEVADGVHVHPINTLTYARGDAAPERRARDSGTVGRDPSTFTLFVPLFTVVGDTDEERGRWREISRTMVGFYGSTPNYAFIFEQLGRPGHHRGAP